MNSPYFILRAFLASTFLLLAVSFSSPLFAQGDPGDGGPEPDPEPTAVPIDGGASLLLAGGVAYGLNNLRKRRS
ncbi:PID-CTERM protein-sorting domain-containing protein [Hymenobacter sp. J193]|uniref:PID-CTERM protein-sorting domain-containing protein n=1 Tax=Hymenobacter sp. J193 TaxID=2898429 RepID=UPI0035B2A8A2